MENKKKKKSKSFVAVSFSMLMTPQIMKLGSKLKTDTKMIKDAMFKIKEMSGDIKSLTFKDIIRTKIIEREYREYFRKTKFDDYLKMILGDPKQYKSLITELQYKLYEDFKNLTLKEYIELVLSKADYEKRMLEITDEEVNDFANGVYRNNFYLFIASSTIFLLSLLFLIGFITLSVNIFSLESGLLIGSTIIMIALSFLKMILYSLNCYIMRVEKLEVFKEFIMNYRNWLPKRPKNVIKV